VPFYDTLKPISKRSNLNWNALEILTRVQKSVASLTHWLAEHFSKEVIADKTMGARREDSNRNFDYICIFYTQIK